MPTNIDPTHNQSDIDITLDAPTWSDRVTILLKRWWTGTFGTAALLDVGTDPEQIPRNSDLGSASKASVGEGEDQVPTNEMLGQAAQLNVGEADTALPTNADLGSASKVDVGNGPEEISLNRDLPQAQVGDDTIGKSKLLFDEGVTETEGHHITIGPNEGLRLVPPAVGGGNANVSPIRSAVIWSGTRNLNTNSIESFDIDQTTALGTSFKMIGVMYSVRDSGNDQNIFNEAKILAQQITAGTTPDSPGVLFIGRSIQYGFSGVSVEMSYSNHTLYLNAVISGHNPSVRAIIGYYWD